MQNGQIPMERNLYRITLKEIWSIKLMLCSVITTSSVQKQEDYPALLLICKTFLPEIPMNSGDVLLPDQEINSLLQITASRK